MTVLNIHKYLIISLIWLSFCLIWRFPSTIDQEPNFGLSKTNYKISDSKSFLVQFNSLSFFVFVNILWLSFMFYFMCILIIYKTNKVCFLSH